MIQDDDFEAELLRTSERRALTTPTPGSNMGGLPVAWIVRDKLYRDQVFLDRQKAQNRSEDRDMGSAVIPLYEHPRWVTDRMLKAACDQYWGSDVDHGQTARSQMRSALEAALATKDSPQDLLGGSETEASDRICQEADGCPTEMAVLKRFWRQHQKDSPQVRLVVTEAMVDAADSVLSRSRPGIPDEVIRMAIAAALSTPATEGE